MRLQQAEPSFHPNDLKFDLTESTINEARTDDLDCNLPFGLNEENSLELETFGVVPHSYVEGLLSGLDDCSEFLEYTDIG